MVPCLPMAFRNNPEGAFSFLGNCDNIFPEFCLV